MSNIKNKNKIYVSKEITNNSAYMVEYFLCYFMPSNEILREIFSTNTLEKYHSFMEALNTEADHLQCDEFTNERIIECGFNFED